MSNAMLTIDSDHYADHWSMAHLEAWSKEKIHLTLGPNTREKIRSCRDFLEQKIQNSDSPIYGINTGFGALCKVEIPSDQLNALQHNLVRSHACGTGAMLPPDISKLMLLLKIRGLSQGHSGVSVSLVERMAEMYNEEMYPLIPEQGSLGASGDLAPLAHLSLPLFGEGQVYYQGKILEAAQMLEMKGWKPMQLGAKEGLALLNGTQFMSAIGCYAIIQSKKLMEAAIQIAALSCDAFLVRDTPFHELIAEVRPHTGHLQVAKKMLELLKGSEIGQEVKTQVQDPYSFRCIPQVLGASMDVLDFVEKTLTTEINGVTDNPLIFPNEDLILSGGNFHGQPLAFALDFMAIAMAEIGNISERRVYQLISGQRGLPEFLAANPGLHSGLMIPQYTAASIASQNKQLCTPASVDSIVSSNGQEDHVSMGANAATKLLKVLDNLQTLLAIELLTGAQALDFRRPVKSSSSIELLKENFRAEVPFVDQDRVLAHDIVKARTFINQL